MILRCGRPPLLILLYLGIVSSSWILEIVAAFGNSQSRSRNNNNNNNNNNKKNSIKPSFFKSSQYQQIVEKQQHQQQQQQQQEQQKQTMTDSPSAGTSVQIKAIIFDMDGTLLDTETLSDKAILFAIPSLSEEIRESYAPSYRIPWELKQQLLGLRGSEWCPIVLDWAQQKWNVPKEFVPTVDELWKSWEDNLNSYCEHVQACPGATELVQALAAATTTPQEEQENRIPMAIATSSRYAAVEIKRKHHQESMFQYMTHIVAGDDPAVQNGKPAPDIYLEAMKRLGISDPSECLVFEDALSGVRSGKAAGCKVVAVPDPRFTTEEKQVFFKEADVVLNSLHDFDGTPFGIDINLAANAVVVGQH